jgi:hypothetical protein
MRLMLLSLFALAIATLLPAGDGVAAPQQFAQSSPVDTIQVGPRDRICCKRGWQDWWSSKRQCRRAGGVRVANRACRQEWNDRWDIRWWNWPGRDWDDRVCCKRGSREWWTTAGQCRNAFGYQTANRFCRR